MSEYVGNEAGKPQTKVMELKPEMRNINMTVRVISSDEPKTISTRSGQRTISEAIVGDETGRVKLTLWGKAAGTVEEGQVIEIRGAWTTTYRGDVQLNIGGANNVKVVTEHNIPEAENIPEDTPKAPEGYRPPRRGFRRGYGTRRQYWSR